MKVILIAAAGLAGVVAAGCGTVKEVNANAWAKDYYNQPNTASIAKICGDNVTLTITGAKSIEINTPVPTKNIIPRDPSVLDSIGGLFGSVMPWLAGAYVGGMLADRPTTVKPEVVTKEVLVPVAGATP